MILYKTIQFLKQVFLLLLFTIFFFYFSMFPITLCKKSLFEEIFVLYQIDYNMQIFCLFQKFISIQNLSLRLRVTQTSF